MSRTVKTIVIVLAAAVAAFYVLPRVLRMAQGPTKPTAPEPPGESSRAKGKKTIFGKIVNGVTELSQLLPGDYSKDVKTVGGVFDQFTI
jgi:hypothetical protein